MKNPFTLTSADAVRFLEEQLEEWPLARHNYEGLAHVRSRKINMRGGYLRVQYNPARIRSTAAEVDKESIQKRPCFLCEANQPPEQRRLPFGDNYWLMVNPYPIFPRHFTIASRWHAPQSIFYRYTEMLQMAQSLDEFVIFYNGPRCGASAPDHAHFQAGNKGFLPVEKQWREKCWRLSKPNRELQRYMAYLYYITMEVWETSNIETAREVFENFYYSEMKENRSEEPMMNLLVWYDKKEGKWCTACFLRRSHRPKCYYAEGDDKLLVSPAAVDFGGVIVLPRLEDYRKITATHIRHMMKEIELCKE